MKTSMADSIPPQNPPKISGEQFLGDLRNEINDEFETDYANEVEKATGMSAREMKNSDLNYIPHVVSNRLRTAERDTLRIQVPDTGSVNNKSISGDFGIFTDDEVLIKIESDEQSTSIEGKVVDVTDPCLKIRPHSDNAKKLQRKLSRANNITLTGLVNTTTYDRRYKAIDQVEEHPILPILVGDEPVNFSHQRVSNTREFDKDLYDDDRQSKGIRKALSAEKIACLQGPPGTGKTRVIIELVRRMALAGCRVLVAAETNAAVDNFLVGSTQDDLIDDDSLLYHHENNGLDVARTNSDNDSTHPVAAEKFQSIDPQTAQVVASTHSSSAILPNEQSFDYVIVDEASQASIPSSLISIIRGDTCILVGDHKQLPPFTQQRGMRKSMIDRLYSGTGIYGSKIGVRFNKQYRMDERIADFPSKEFYEGDLETASSANIHRRDLEMEPIGIYDIEGSNERGNESKFNPAEADRVEMVLEMLIDRKSVRSQDIGIAAPYGRQVDFIRSQIETSNLPSVGDVKVDTFDSFQGSERKTMILSFTRSNRARLGKIVWFS